MQDGDVDRGGWRLLLCFSVLAIVPAVVLARLWALQVRGGVTIQRGMRDDGTRPSALEVGPQAAQRQVKRERELPAPRATIEDRRRQPLAMDRPVMSVHASVTVPRKYRADPREVRRFVHELAENWASRLVLDPDILERAGDVATVRDQLEARLHGALKLVRLPEAGPVHPEAYPECSHADILVHPNVGSGVAMNSLYTMAESEAYRQLLRLDVQPTWEREYLERDATWGVVGVLEEWQPGVPGEGRSGLEALLEKIGSKVARGAAGREMFAIDVGQRRQFWLGGGVAPEEAPVVQTTLDLRLQVDATRFLEEAAEAGTKLGTKGEHGPTWGGLVLVEIETGDVLAMASWHAEQPRMGSLVPYQNAYEPGSIVKPLMMAWALQHGTLQWQSRFDCTPQTASFGWRHPEWKVRRVHDDHRCEVLTPHEIIMNSSNIGAVQVGMTMGKAEWLSYLDFYGWGRSTGLGMPGESVGRLPAKADLADAEGRRLTEYGIPSLAIGYGINVTALQVARAYLSMLHGEARELRLVRSITDANGRRELAPAKPGPTRLNQSVVEAIVAAMQAVVSDQEGATGRLWLWPMLRDAGVPAGYFAGKSGTAVSHPAVRVDGQWKKINVRNASFVSFAPAHAPRYLAVCVLQKERTERFYGGRYAAPAAGRLLLRALREDGVTFSGAGQVSVGSPENPAGAGGPR